MLTKMTYMSNISEVLFGTRCPLGTKQVSKVRANETSALYLCSSDLGGWATAPAPPFFLAWMT